MVNCPHWRACSNPNGGCCAIGRYDRPSIGVCLACLKTRKSDAPPPCCWNCGSKDHHPNDCPEPARVNPKLNSDGTAGCGCSE